MRLSACSPFFRLTASHRILRTIHFPDDDCFTPTGYQHCNGLSIWAKNALYPLIKDIENANIPLNTQQPLRWGLPIFPAPLRLGWGDPVVRLHSPLKGKGLQRDICIFKIPKTKRIFPDIGNSFRSGNIFQHYAIIYDLKNRGNEYNAIFEIREP